jgi:hypothetical protein
MTVCVCTFFNLIPNVKSVFCSGNPSFRVGPAKPWLCRGSSEQRAFFLFPPNLFYSLQRGTVSRPMTTNEQLTHQIAAQLQETTPLVVFKIYSIIQVFGPDRATAAIPLAQEMYSQEPLIKDGSRRRTLGGCWFKQYSPQELRRACKFRKAMRSQLGLTGHSVPEGIFDKTE